jgi:hypothetical protein
MSDATQYPESTIINTLTSEGAVPLELCFVLRKCIYQWHPEEELFSGFMIEEDLAAAGCNYLQRQGMCFNDTNDLADRARSRNWPNLDKFLSLIKHW